MRSIIDAVFGQRKVLLMPSLVNEKYYYYNAASFSLLCESKILYIIIIIAS